LARIASGKQFDREVVAIFDVHRDDPWRETLTDAATIDACSHSLSPRDPLARRVRTLAVRIAVIALIAQALLLCRAASFHLARTMPHLDLLHPSRKSTFASRSVPTPALRPDP
jgi:hypothetical protein